MNNTISVLLSSENISPDLYYVAVLNGSNCKSLQAFLKEIGRTFKFPSYYGRNLNALNDCLNDLSWINKPNYLLCIINSKDFLIKESNETKEHILQFLERISKQWSNVPNYNGEDAYRKKADFRIRWL
jgi:RNAse (barnase) inhibitor barstar